jgi:hypothetical protein
MVKDSVLLGHRTVNSIRGLARELLGILETPLRKIDSGE